MNTLWIEEKALARTLARHEAFWRGELEEGPLMWVTAANAKPGPVPLEPANEEELWTNVDYVIAATEASLGRTHFAGDALPVFCPWLGPDQFAAWLGAELALRPRDFTSWAEPFVEDWDEAPEFRIAPDNRWWRLYLDILRESVHAGRDKWVTGYPDLHTGIDALSAIRGRERLALDLTENPAAVHRAMRQMTALWKWVVDVVVALALASGLFGACHLLTWTYAIIAACIGVYLGLLWVWTDNLLAPMVTHGVYDFAALVYFLRVYRSG